jgi:hypothetical protein
MQTALRGTEATVSEVHEGGGWAMTDSTSVGDHSVVTTAGAQVDDESVGSRRRMPPHQARGSWPLHLARKSARV